MPRHHDRRKDPNPLLCLYPLKRPAFNPWWWQAHPLPKDAVLSASVEHHNQRLEFLGDSVIELISSHHLFTMLPDEEEGGLTQARRSSRLLTSQDPTPCLTQRLA